MGDSLPSCLDRLNHLFFFLLTFNVFDYFMFSHAIGKSTVKFLFCCMFFVAFLIFLNDLKHLGGGFLKVRIYFGSDFVLFGHEMAYSDPIGNSLGV